MRNNKYLYFFLLAQGLSAFGLGIQSMCLTLKIFQSSSTAQSLARYASVVAIPAVIVSLLGGRVADRFKKRDTLVITQIIAITQQIAMAVATSRLVPFSMPLILIVAMVGVTAFWFEMPVRQSMIATLTRTNPCRTQGHFGWISALAGTAGYTSGGVLATHGGECLGFIACAMLMVIGMFLISSIPPSEGESALLKTDSPEVSSVSTSLTSSEYLLALALTAALCISGGRFFNLLPVLGDRFNLDSTGVGWLVGATSLGACLAGLFLATQTTSCARQILKRAFLALAVMAPLNVVMALSAHLSVTIVAAGLGGACYGYVFNSAVSAIQQTVNAAVRGRALGRRTMLQAACEASGSLSYAYVSDSYGCRSALLLIAFVTLMLVVLAAGIVRQCAERRLQLLFGSLTAA